MMPASRSTHDRELFEFLPAAIELEQTPSSKAGRMIIWAIIVLFVIAIAWACFGKIDIVAVAQGRIIPSDHSKQIQAFEVARIDAIHVREGQTVQQGDALVTLNSKQASADVQRLAQEITEREHTIQRLRAFEAWITGANAPLDDGLALHQQPLLRQETDEFQSRLETLANETRKLDAERSMVSAEISKKQRVLPILKERVDALETLHKKEFGSKLQFLELKQQWIEQEEDLAVQQARRQQLDAQVQGMTTQQATLIAEQRKRNLGQLQETELQLASLQQEQIKAQERLSQHQLTAPISGQVQQLAIHTIGGVVTEAQPLMIIVPQDDILEVEAKLLNKDIGFVQEGQTAEVKIDTFNFTKYGFIDAEILSISDDAIQDEQLGLIYNTRLKLKQNGLNVDGKWVKLSPGMSVTAEVKTGTRRLIEFFLSPLLRYQQESLGER
jgi:hemolysin D